MRKGRTVPRTTPFYECVLLAGTCGLLAWGAAGVFADEPAKPLGSRDEILAEKRGEMMRRLAADFRIESAEAGFPRGFEPKPLLRYTDAARGTVAGSVWRLGSTGRPKALLAMELNRATQRRPNILYEYGSLTATPFTMTGPDLRWSPSRTLYEFQPLPEARPPEKTPARRLIQMREFAKRFAGSEVHNGDRCQLRLLPQPVDRYQPTSSPNSDGAIFLYAFGTNPELVLLLETDGTAWTYAIGRMTGAEVITMTLDGERVWEGIPVTPESGSDPYTYVETQKPVEIPGFDAEGQEKPLAE